MRPLVAVLVAAIMLVAGTSRAAAADPELVDVVVERPDIVTVGDRVHYEIVVDADEGTRLALAPAALPPEVALVDTPQTARRSLGGGREQVTFSFDLAPFVPGQIDLPQIPIRYSAPDGSSGLLQVAAGGILVNSVLPATGDLTPRDLKAQAEIGSPPPAWIVPALAASIAALVLLVAALLARRAILKRRTLRSACRPPRVLGPEDIARGALDQTGAAFAVDGDHMAYYTSLANTVRRYLTERYGFPAFALTTAELEDAMLARGLNRWQVRVAGGLLEQCDSVVYAQYRPAAERADADLTAAYEVVEISRPEDRPLIEEEEEVPVS